MGKTWKRSIPSKCAASSCPALDRVKNTRRIFRLEFDSHLYWCYPSAGRLKREASMKCPVCHFDNLDTSRFCSDCGTQLLSSKEIPATRPVAFHTPPKALPKGATFGGRYKIIEPLGRGGMGIIYKAEDTKLKRIAALKFLPPELIRDPEAKGRFIQEAQAASALDHPEKGEML